MGEIEKLEQGINEINEELVEVDAEITKWKNIQRKLQAKKTALQESIRKLKSETLSRVDWSGNDYEWTSKVNRLLKEVFLLQSFRAKQLSAINSTLSKCHAIVVMPTGAGKSLCYQLPALVNPGLTLVVSPLISLIEDQVRSLKKKKIAAAYLTCSSSKKHVSDVLNDLKTKSDMKLLYVTPERFTKSKRFMGNLQKCFTDGRLQRIAIDEVHCCSQWGHDFRPDYKYLGIITKMFPNVPILGVTATATAHVLTDVQKMLNLSGCLIIKSTFNRPNLFYKILEKPSSQDQCLTLLEKLLTHRYKGESGIIYTNSIKDSEDVANGLRMRGVKVKSYHASMDADERSKVHMAWHDKEFQAIVATVAFGMGIDKPDVRFVIHHTISKSMENYYQESGRAGRDGLRAECITLYRLQDVFKVSTMVFSSVGKLDHLYGMIKYCLNGTICRRQLIAEHFDEDWGNSDCNQMCDVCCNPNNEPKQISLSDHCKILARILDATEKYELKITAQKLIDAWYQKGPMVLRSTGPIPTFSRDVAEDVIAYLLVVSYLEETFHFTAFNTISYLKKGPNMEFVNDPNFTLEMPIRKYTPFDLESPPPTMEVNTNEEEDRNPKKRKLNVKENETSKCSKVIVIKDDNDKAG